MIRKENKKEPSHDGNVIKLTLLTPNKKYPARFEWAGYFFAPVGIITIFTFRDKLRFVNQTLESSTSLFCFLVVIQMSPVSVVILHLPPKVV